MCPGLIFQSHHLCKVPVTPHSWDSALLPLCSPQHQPSLWVSCCPSQTRSSLRTKAKSCSSWCLVERLRGSVFQTKKGLSEKLLKMKGTSLSPPSSAPLSTSQSPLLPLVSVSLESSSRGQCGVRAGHCLSSSHPSGPRASSPTKIQCSCSAPEQ